MTFQGSTLIICSRNRPELLSDTVASVFEGTILPDELIIVDQSDTPHPAFSALSVHKDCQVRYIKSNTTGVCRARNEGMKAASHNLLVFIDDDMHAPREWFANLLKATVEAGENSVTTGQVLPGHAEQAGGFVPAVVDGKTPQTYTGRIWTDVLASCNMAMYSSACNKIGGFDERLGPGTRFPAADDNDYGYRLLEAGYEIRYSPQASILHRAWRGAKEYYSHRWGYGRGKGGFYTKHLTPGDGYMLRRMLGDILIRFVRFPWRVLHKPRLAVGDLYYGTGIISGCIDWFYSYTIKPK